MTMDAFLRVAYEGLLLVILLSAGPALAAFVVSVIISGLQAATQMHDVTLTFVPKIAAALTVVILLGTWIMAQLSSFTTNLLAQLPTVGRAGG